MPGGDGTGPSGAGPMTGRAGGFCAGYLEPELASVTTERGFRRFLGGFGRGRRNRLFVTGIPGWAIQNDPTLSPDAKAGNLKNQAKVLQSSLDAINQKIAELEATGK